MTTTTVTLSQVAREMKVKPKMARQFARRHKKDLPVKPIRGQGWTFPASARAKLKKFLRA